MTVPAVWFRHLPLYVQFILSLVMLDWLFFQCWYAQHVLSLITETE